MASYIAIAGLYLTFARPLRNFLQVDEGNIPEGSFGQNHPTMKSRKPWIPFILVFIILNGFFIAGKNWLIKKGVDQEVLIVGNLVLFLATLLSFLVYFRSLNAKSPSASVRGMYGSFLIKFFVCLIAAFVYILIAKKNVNKPALIICMGLYIVYTVIEVSALQKLLKQKNKEKIK
jgi:hypothetical protein